MKKDKIILLTTHSLEEAEELSDRIGIMKEGKLLCCGTSNFLKSKFTSGININFLFNSLCMNNETTYKWYDNVYTYPIYNLFKFLLN